MVNIRFGALRLESARLQHQQSRQANQPQFSLKFFVKPGTRKDLAFPNLLNGLGFHPLKLKLTADDKGKLKFESEYEFVKEEHLAYETHVIPDRYIQVGDRITPYSYASEAGWTYTTEQVPVIREKRETVQEQKLIKDQAVFNDLYRLLSVLSSQHPAIRKALGLVEQVGHPFVQRAKRALDARSKHEAKLSQARQTQGIMKRILQLKRRKHA